ncbi:unnamed protein product [Protopolystoma xenopodis]|uniref:Uncharacterized protein n=1 Tax=Protopolystoma xenopodis TaxID=117903 RepID=A0A3S5ARW8_9PLAT|nr:unnamed protein product [Protopolystoma xenopodis]
MVSEFFGIFRVVASLVQLQSNNFRQSPHQVNRQAKWIGSEALCGDPDYVVDLKRIVLTGEEIGRTKSYYKPYRLLCFRPIYLFS